MVVGLVDLLDAGRYYPVYQSLCTRLDSVSLLYLSWTCPRLGTLYSDNVANEWDVNRLVGRFVSSPPKFRVELEKHGAVLSGSLALQFFERVTWKESDMDVFVKKGRGDKELGNYLVDLEGYSKEKRSRRVIREYAGTSFTVETYVRGTGKVQIITVKKEPVESILEGFYGSAVTNIITGKKAYALFPVTTFLERRTCVFRQGCGEEEQLAKYQRRGWKTSYLGDNDHIELAEARYVGDRFTWTIPLKALSGGEASALTGVERCRFAVADKGGLALLRSE